MGRLPSSVLTASRRDNVSMPPTTLPKMVCFLFRCGTARYHESHERESSRSHQQSSCPRLTDRLDLFLSVPYSFGSEISVELDVDVAKARSLPVWTEMPVLVKEAAAFPVVYCAALYGTGFEAPVAVFDFFASAMALCNEFPCAAFCLSALAFATASLALRIFAAFPKALVLTLALLSTSCSGVKVLAPS
ncbi:hypothetical protein KCU90_g135, partial [Aureobasidium melanogenum]